MFVPGYSVTHESPPTKAAESGRERPKASHKGFKTCMTGSCPRFWRPWAWAVCDKTGANLALHGDVWYHKIGKLYDLCGAAFEELVGDGHDGFGFVRVTCAADLGVRLPSLMRGQLGRARRAGGSLVILRARGCANIV